MGTTSSAIAALALDALEASPVRFALLHGEIELLNGTTTADVDVVVDHPPVAAARLLIPRLREAGLFAVVLCPYDIAAAALYLSTVDGSDGVQLDLAWDPDGRGKRGTCFSAVLDAAVLGRRWPVVQPVDQLLYLARKRHEKRQPDRLEAVLRALRNEDGGAVTTRIQETLTPQAAKEVSALLTCGPAHVTYKRSSMYFVRTGWRFIERLRRPVGYWVELQGDGDSTELEASAYELALRFGRILPYAVAIERPIARAFQQGWWLRHVAPVRWRPGLVASWSTSDPSRPKPDLVLHVSESSLEALPRSVVAAMAQHCAMHAYSGQV